MSGQVPAKDTLVHNNLAHKLMHYQRGSLVLTLMGDLREVCFAAEEDNFESPPLVKIEEDGFRVTKAGASYILANLRREVLSHREVKIMKDLTRPPATPKVYPVAPGITTQVPKLLVDELPREALVF